MKSIWPPLLKLAAYTVVTAIATGLLVMVIVNGRTGPTTSYRAVFTDVSGVTANDNVKIAGVAVGKVIGVRVVDRNRGEVEFTVDEDVVVPESVQVTIRYENLIGDRFLDLERPEGPVGEPLSVHGPEGPVAGRFAGLDDEGALRIVLAEGGERRFTYGDVTLARASDTEGGKDDDSR